VLSSGHGAGVHSHVPLPRVAVSRPRCVGLVDRTSGGGGLARRATTAAGAVLAVVTTAITAIVIFVVVLGLVATGAAVSAIGWARSHRERNVGVERRRGSQRPDTVHVNLFQ
jgi:hypothetical protein